jgi:hypothetical protein
VVISDNLYVPLNIKATVSYVASAGKIKQATLTSKQIVKYLGSNYYTSTFTNGTQLVVGPGSDVYATYKTNIVADLTSDGFVAFAISDTIDTSTGTEYSTTTSYKYSEAGVVKIDFYSDGNYSFPVDNDYSAELSGSYTYYESDSKENSAFIYTQSSKFSSKNLSGLGYDHDMSTDALPVSGSASGSASGRLLD